MALTSRTNAAKGDFTQRSSFTFGQGGDTLAWEGVAGATEDLVIDKAVSKIELSAVGASDNDFDMPAGAVHGQEVLITLVAKGGAGNATITEDAGVIILAEDAGDVATITLDAANEYVLLRWEYDHWKIVATTATVAAV